MLQLNHIIGGVLDYCRHPSESDLPRGIIAERFIDRWAYYVNQLSLTGEAWQVEKATIDVVPNQAEYTLNAPYFGKPVVVYVLDDQQQIAGELDIGRFRDQIGNGVVTNVPSNYSLPASEVPAGKNTITFFNESGQLKARLAGTPTTSGTLIVHYTPSSNQFFSLQDGITLLDNFANLFKIHTAIVCLPDCTWKRMSKEDCREKRKDIKESLLMEFELLTIQFTEYKNTLFQEQTAPRRGWGEDYECLNI